MQPDPRTPPPNGPTPPDGAPPVIPPTPPPVGAGSAPPLPPSPARTTSGGRQFLAFLLSVCLGLFLADALASFLDDSLIMLFGIHALSAIRSLVCFFAMAIALVVYLLMGLTPMIPKRLFIPVTLFNPAVGLFAVPAVIYFYSRVQQVTWVISLCQVVFGVGMLCWFRGGFKLGWPLVSADQLQPRRFSWLNLSGFLLANVFVVLPAVIIYLGVCAGLAVGHFSEGFLALRPSGFSVQARKYVRQDGKSIQLVPMAHVGDAAFYRKLSDSFPTNSLILMEGVTDNRNLLTNHITYHRMANSLGLAEQQKEFQPTRGEMVHADIDVEEFTPNTIGFLNLVMLIHARGLDPGNLLMLLQYSPPPHFEERLFDDLLRKRNRHLLGVIDARLAESEALIVPWGVAHIPELAREIQKSGFRLAETQQYQLIRFWPGAQGRAQPHREK
jgi:hypothetical protein